MQDLQPTLVSRHSKSNVLSTKIFLTVLTYVFIRQDCVRRSLQQPCDGPFEIISHNNKFFTLLIKRKKSVISVDRLKPAFVKIEDPIQLYPGLIQCRPRLRPGMADVWISMHYNSSTKKIEQLGSYRSNVLDVVTSFVKPFCYI
ncbi:hypothetical protein TNCT_202491 [Trichonephila clavata]|uniref:Uncharacterized protein n=1 Tax=Trichonephila clavata TaxID=2740835 RepID=A0A8X6HCR5_TRICU|nr:hypothetical protein TNCT_202491 [Trichonephila clavata]